jgi:hypothetical protein
VPYELDEIANLIAAWIVAYELDKVDRVVQDELFNITGLAAVI